MAANNKTQMVFSDDIRPVIACIKLWKAYVVLFTALVDSYFLSTKLRRCCQILLHYL